MSSVSLRLFPCKSFLYKWLDAFPKEQLEGTIILAKDHFNEKYNKVVKQYSFCPVEYLEKVMEMIEDEYRVFYEVECFDEELKQERKLKFDIDVSKSKNSLIYSQFNDMLEKTISDIKAVFKEEYDKELTRDNIIIFNSSTDEKASVHIVIDGYKVSSNEQAKYFRQKVSDRNPTFSSFIDPQVYSTFQCFRLQGNHKYGKQNNKVMTTGKSFLSGLTTYVKDCELLDDLIIVKKKKTYPKRSYGDDLISIIQEKLDEMEANVEVREKDDGTLVFANIGERKCLVTPTESHVNNNGFITIEDHDVYYHCHASECKGKKSLVLTLENGTIDVDIKEEYKRLLPAKKGESKEEVTDEVVEEEEFEDHGELLKRKKKEEKKEDTPKENNQVLVNTDSYEGVKQEFEKKVFKCVNESQYYIIDGENIYVKSKAELTVSYNHLKYVVTDKYSKDYNKKKTFIKKWLTDEEQRRYDKVDSIIPPRVCPNNYYNLWNGIAIEKVKIEEGLYREEVEFIKEHMFKLSGENKETYDYFLRWTAHKMYNPGAKIKVCPILITKQGLGKGIWFEMMSTILGKEHCLITPDISQHIFGGFNGLLENKLLVVLDEMNIKDGRIYKEKLKSFITEETLNINEKNVKGRTRTSNIDCIVFSNNGIPVVIDPAERRYMVINSDMEREDHEYYTKLWKYVKDEKICRAVYEDFKQYVEDNYDWVKNRTLNERYQTIIEASLDVEIGFLEWLVYEVKEETEYKSSDFYILFQDYLVKEGTKYNTSNKALTIKLKTYNLKGLVWRRSNGAKIWIEPSKLKEEMIRNKWMRPDIEEEETHKPLLHAK